MGKFIFAALMLSISLSVYAQEKPCSQNPRVIGSSFVVHGRLAYYNGTPTVRLWRIGTKRILGVAEHVYSVKGYVNLPKSIEDKLSWKVYLYGDFLVYPFTKSQPGVMQMICIESVKNLVIKERQG